LDDAGYEQVCLLSFLSRNDIPNANLFATQGLLLPGVHSSSTVQNFMNGSFDLEEGEFSDVAIRAMASLLFERTTHAAIQWKPGVFHLG
jgi:hypothetical protein